MTERDSAQRSPTPTLRIAVCAPLSGRGAALGREMVQAAQLAVDDTLEKGGIPGMRLEAWTLDDKGEEREGVRVAQQIAQDASALGVIGHYNSNITLEAAPLYCQSDLPLVSPIVSNPKLTESGWQNTFRFTNRDDATARALVDYLVGHLGKKTAVTVATDTVYGHSMTQEFVRAFQRTGGRIVAQHRVPEGQVEFDDLVRCWPNEIDMAFYGGTFEGAPLLHAMRNNGLQQLLASGDGCWDVENFLRPAGIATTQGEGVLVLSACEEIGKVAGSRGFAARYEKKFGPIINYAVLSYDATNLLIEAIKSAVSRVTRPVTRRDVLSVLQDVAYEGIAYQGTVKRDAQGDNVAACTALHVVRAGHFAQVHCALRRQPPV